MDDQLPSQLTDQQRQYRFEQAKRIMDEPIVRDVLAGLRNDALEALAQVAADDQISILRLQANIAVIDNFRDSFEAFILDGQEIAGGAEKVL